MAKIIALVNQKGGVGKTTTAVNLGAYLAQMGKFVLLVDLDPQSNASSGLGVNHQELPYGLYEALITPDKVGLKHIIRDTAHPGYRLAPTTPQLSGANIDLVHVDDRERRLYDILAPERNNYDYILIDCPPSLGLLTINGLVAADEVLIPLQAEYFALEGLGQLLQTIGLIRDNLKPDLAVLGAVLTMFDTRLKLSQDVLQELHRYFPDRVFRSVIPRSVRLSEAPSHGQTILQYDPRSKAAKAYERLAREVLSLHGF